MQFPKLHDAKHPSSYLKQSPFFQGLQAAFYITIVELFALKYRSKVGTVQILFWAVGVMLLALISFVIQDWKYIQLFITLTTFLQIGLIW